MRLWRHDIIGACFRHVPRDTTRPAFHHHRHPFFMAHQNVGYFCEVFTGHFTWRTKSPVAMPALLAETSSTFHIEKKGPHPVLGNIYVFLVPIYSVCKRSDFAIKMLPANCLSPYSVTIKMSHKAFDLLDSIFGPIFRIFSGSSIVSLLT